MQCECGRSFEQIVYSSEELSPKDYNVLKSIQANVKCGICEKFWCSERCAEAYRIMNGAWQCCQKCADY